MNRSVMIFAYLALFQVVIILDAHPHGVLERAYYGLPFLLFAVLSIKNFKPTKTDE